MILGAFVHKYNSTSSRAIIVSFRISIMGPCLSGRFYRKKLNRKEITILSAQQISKNNKYISKGTYIFFVLVEYTNQSFGDSFPIDVLRLLLSKFYQHANQVTRSETINTAYQSQKCVVMGESEDDINSFIYRLIFDKVPDKVIQTKIRNYELNPSGDVSTLYHEECINLSFSNACHHADRTDLTDEDLQCAKTFSDTDIFIITYSTILRYSFEKVIDRWLPLIFNYAFDKALGSVSIFVVGIFIF